MARRLLGACVAAAALSACGIEVLDGPCEVAPVCADGNAALFSMGALPTREVVWNHKLDVQRIRRVTLGVEYLYVESDGGLLTAVGRHDGMVAWMYRHPLGHAATWPPVEVPSIIRDRLGNEAEEERLLAKVREQSRKTRLTAQDFEQIDVLRRDRANAGSRVASDDPFDNVYFITENELVCLERRTGRQTWSRALAYGAAARPAASRDLVFIPCAYPARVVAHSTALKEKGRDVAFFRSAMVARDNFVTEAPLFDSPNVIFPTNDGAIYAYDTRPKDRIEVAWIFNAGATIREPLSMHTTADVRVDAQGKVILVDDQGKPTEDAAKGRMQTDVYKMVLASALDRQLYAVDASAGAAIWKYPLGGYADGPAVGSGETVYVRVENDSLKALDAIPAERDAKGRILRRADGKIQQVNRSGRLRWQLPGGERFVVRLDGGRVLVMGPHRELYLMDDAGGRTLGRYPTFGLDFILTNVQDNLLYVATQDGRLFAMREPAPQAE